MMQIIYIVNIQLSTTKSRIQAESFTPPDGIKVDSGKNKLQLFTIE
jgi:hypothetical protein